MSKLAVVYWSGTGNTQAMAEAVASGAVGEVEVFTSATFKADMLNDFEAIAFGCPAMGAEELEDTEFAPLFDSCNISGKKIGLFGSYGWGDGEWMRNWEELCINRGANVISQPVICTDAPDDTAIEMCKALGRALSE